MQAQSIRDSWISTGAIRNKKLNKFIVKSSSNGTEYLVIVKKERTKKELSELTWIKMLIAYTIYIVLIRTYRIVSDFSFQQRFQLPSKHFDCCVQKAFFDLGKLTLML